MTADGAEGATTHHEEGGESEERVPRVLQVLQADEGCLAAGSDDTQIVRHGEETLTEELETIEKEMKEGKKYPFDSLVYCNIGNPQVGHAESL